jgi:hypothetical protein
VWISIALMGPSSVSRRRLESARPLVGCLGALACIVRWHIRAFIPGDESDFGGFNE